jgi:ribonucleotide reductase alpha subunit
MEIQLPTKPYKDMLDLYGSRSKQGETAFCSLSAINVSKVSDEEYEEIAELTLEAIDIMIEQAPMMTKAMKADILERRSVGVGITGLASELYQSNLDYNDSTEALEKVSYLAERHYYYLLKASQKLAEEAKWSVSGIKKDWLPIDTAVGEFKTHFDWEALRGKPRKHSVLVAHMPCESSSLLSGSTNGLYPVRDKIISKKSRKGVVQFICNEWKQGVHKPAWDVDNITLSKVYGFIQNFTDQAISADFYVVPEKFADGKVPMSQLIKEWVIHAKLGNKTKYYVNTKTTKSKTLHSAVEEEDGCVSCKL